MNVEMGPRVQAWFQIVIGIGLGLGGLATLLDANSPKIYLGAIIVAPIFIYRGIRVLKAAAEMDAANPHWDRAADAPHPDGTKAFAVRAGSLFVKEHCFACGKPYFYFPAMTPNSMACYQTMGHSAAPCPRCGFLQPGMIDAAGEFTNATLWTKAAFYGGVALLCGSALLLVSIMVKFHGSFRPEGDPAEEWKYWLGLGALAIPGAVLSGWGGFRNRALADPNVAPIDLRLRIGRTLGMPLEEYETLVNSEGFAPGIAHGSSTQVQAGETQPRPKSSDDATGV